MQTKLGTITFTTASALALWNNEVLGQLSDGMWENTGPHDHWEFWHDLNASVGDKDEVKTDKPWACKKTGYNIAGLKQYVKERMLATGRAAAAGLDAGRDDKRWARMRAWERMVELGSFEAFEKTAGSDPEIALVTTDDARAFYNTKYDDRELNADIKRIKAAMKTARYL